MLGCNAIGTGEVGLGSCCVKQEGAELMVPCDGCVRGKESTGMSSKQELSFSDGDSCGCATSHRSSTRCPIAASGLRGLSISSRCALPWTPLSPRNNSLARSLCALRGGTKTCNRAMVIRMPPGGRTRCAASNTGFLALWRLPAAGEGGSVLCFCMVRVNGPGRGDELMAWRTDPVPPGPACQGRLLPAVRHWRSHWHAGTPVGAVHASVRRGGPETGWRSRSAVRWIENRGVGVGTN